MILGMLSYSLPREMMVEVKSIQGVTEANFIYGPYDFYVMVKTETKEELSEIVMRIREIEGVRSTMTCNVVSMPAAARSPKE